MIVRHVEQGSDEWFALRTGVITASNFSNVLTTKGEISKSLPKYAHKIACERISGKVEGGFKSFWTDRGHHLEPHARQFYRFATGIEMNETGIIFQDETLRVGGSPDGIEFVLNRGLEIKCPSQEVHLKYLLGQKVPTEYYLQVQGLMWLTGFAWDFMSYHPDFEPLITEAKPDDKIFKALDKTIPELIERVDEITDKYERLKG